MSIQIKNIIENWELLTGGYDYYEEELFTKFQDTLYVKPKPDQAG